MKILRRTAENTFEESVRLLRAHLESADPPHTTRPECRKPRRDEEGQDCTLPTYVGDAYDLVKFHQRMVALRLEDLTELKIACAQVNLVGMSIGFLQRYEQKWEYLRTTMGRPVSYIALAPLERRRVQVAQKRKTSLSRSDRTKRSSRRTYDSASTTKASTSATNSSTSRNKWSASASGSYGLGGVGWGAQVEGSLEGSTEQLRQMAVENIGEETLKSSTEVAAETETTTTMGLQTSFEHIEDHYLVNPYSDRSVLFSLIELTDEFCVKTTTAGLSPCLIFDFDPISSDTRRLVPSIKFDESFVSAHRQFLRTALLDDSLIDFLDSQDALETQPTDGIGEIFDNAERCLIFLFEDDGIFAPTADPDYDIDASFDVTAAQSGFSDAFAIQVTDLYMLLAGVRFLYRRDSALADLPDDNTDKLPRVEFLRRVTEFVILLYNGLAGWAGVTADNKRRLHDDGRKTEQFRRIPAFLELAEQLVVTPLKMRGEQPTVDADSTTTEEDEADEENPAPAAPTTLSSSPRTTPQGRVVNHLNCFGRYYTEEFLHFLYEWTGVAAIVELMASLDDVHRSLVDFVDFERSFVDGTAWVVPFAEVADAQAVADSFLDGGDLSGLKPISSELEVRMPANGVHIEAVPGRCVLPRLPENSAGWPPPPAAYVGTTSWTPDVGDA